MQFSLTVTMILTSLFSQLLEKLLRALAYQCGSEVSVNELSSLLGVSRTLVESYLKLLE